MKRSKYLFVCGLIAILATSILLSVLPLPVMAATVLTDNFTGTTINTSKWAETDAGGIGGGTGNIQQNDTLSASGGGVWGQNYLLTQETYDRSVGGLEMEVDVTIASCGSGSVPGIGYGDPGVLTGGGQSYTIYYFGGVLYLSRQNANSNAENVSTGFTCTDNVPFNVRLTIDDTQGAAVYINDSGTPAAEMTGGTFNNKGFFLEGHSGTTVLDNVAISANSSATEPDAPTDLAAQTSSQQVDLTWSAPGSNGGSAILDYGVEYKRSVDSTWLYFADGNSASTGATVTGLTNGTQYDFRVSAVNGIGSSTPSSTVQATPDVSVPSAPRSLTASSGDNNESELAWTAPLTNGGASITDYTVQYKLSTDSSWSTFSDGVSTETETTVTSLTNGLIYNFRVYAVNSVGSSIASNTATATPNTYTIFDDFTGTSFNTDLWEETDASSLGATTGNVRQNGTLTILGNSGWGSNMLSTVEEYEREDGDITAGVDVTVADCSADTMALSFGGSLTSNSTYFAYYHSGKLNFASFSPGETATISPDWSCTNGVPFSLKMTILEDGGAEVYIDGDLKGTIDAGTYGGNFALQGFVNTVTYDNFFIIEPTTGPAAPSSLTPTAGSGQVGLSWTAGADNGAPITDYGVQYKLTSTGVWSTFDDGVSATTNATVTGLTNGLNYNFRVLAVNGNGTSSPSSTATAKPVSGSATAPSASNVVITGTPAVGETITGTYTFIDPNGDNEATSQYRWLSSDSAGGTYAAISGATDDEYTVTSDDISKYLKFEVTPVSNTAPTTGTPALSAASSQVSEVDFMNLVLSTGQSLSVGIASSPALSTTQPYDNVMLNGAAGGMGTGTSLIPLVESSVETMSSSLGNSLTFNIDDDYTVAVGLHGVSGFTYSQLKKGTSPYSNGMTQVTNVKNAADGLGKTTRVIAVTTIHGETDSFNGVTGPAYQDFLEEWQSDYETDARAITGQSGTIPFFLDQMSSFASSYANMATSAIPIYQLKAAEDNPTKIFLVGPKYYYNYSDRHHLTAASSRWDGEYFAKVIKKVVVDHEAWRPLSPDGATRIGNAVYVDFHVPSGHLVFDTTLVSERDDYGFEYYDSTASASISSVEIVDDDTVKVNLSGVPTGSNQRIRYAYTGVPGTDTGAQNDGSAAGNLRDTDDYPSLNSNTLYNWAVHFDEPIVLDSSAPNITSVSATPADTSSSITWTTNEAATSKVEYGLTNAFGTSTPISDLSGVTSHTVGLTSLISCTNYKYRVVSRDLSSNTSTSSISAFTTTGCTGNSSVASSTTSNVSPSATSTVSLNTSSTENVTLTIPTAFTSIPGTISFQTAQLDKEDFFTAVSSPAGVTPVGGFVYSFSALIDGTTVLSSFDHPIVVTFSYDPSALGSTPASSLVIYRYHGSSWNELSNCSVDTGAHTVSCETSAFSDFAIFGTQSSSGSSGNSGGSSSRRGGSSVRTTNLPPIPLVIPTAAPASQGIFVRDLDVGDTGEDVLALQRYLNGNGYHVAWQGPGSPGSETNLFGYATQAALARYQADHGLTPAIGYFGPKTRAVILGKASLPVTVVFAGESTFTRELDLGDVGEDVRALQKFLNSHGYPVAEYGAGSPGSESLIFGYATQAALARYQHDHDLSPAFGHFGPKTRASIEAVQ